jgi:hypothetical protein
MHRPGAQHQRLSTHLVKQRIHQIQIDGLQQRVSAAHNLKGYRRKEKADGRSDAWVWWDKHQGDTGTACRAAGVKWAVANKRNHRARAKILARLDRMGAPGTGHAFVHDPADSVSGLSGSEAKRCADCGSDGRFGRWAVQLKLAFGKGIRLNIAKGDASVVDCRRGAARTKGDWPRL